ncbi:MAG: esterase/lipase family protein [Planctomycetota bacterium]|jgi:pimeloyl-ACP methyl ester carboxylesterase
MRWILLLLLFVGGCETFVSVFRADPDEKFESEQRSVLDSGELSKRTAAFLERHELQAPADVARFVRENKNRGAAVHLAEFAYHLAEKGEKDSAAMYLTAAAYAWAFLFDEQLGPPASPFDPAYFWANQIYERSLVKLGKPLLEPGNRSLPYLGGTMAYEGPARGPRRDFADNYQVEGVDRVTRVYGLGAAVIAIAEPKGDFTMAWPQTLVVRFRGSVTDDKPLEARGEIHDPTVTEKTEVNGEAVVLEADFSTSLAYAYGASKKVNEWAALLNPEKYLDAHGLYPLQPYNPKKIPVVLVHGLKSTPRTWATMINDLASDPEIRRHYQVWLFGYPTGMPILWSAMKLREALAAAQEEHGFDEIVLIGHSMGGMISRLMVSDSGDKLWNIGTTTPPEKLEFSDETRDLIGRALFFKPVPQIRRVIFIAAPLRGANMVTGGIGEWSATLIGLPPPIEKVQEEYMAALEKDPGARPDAPEADSNTATSVGNLSRNHPVTKEVATWPIAPGVIYHSVIGDKDEADKAGGTDGVVEYDSSHIEGAASEKIVKSGHHVQKTAAGILEVHRILLLHVHLRERATD